MNVNTSSALTIIAPHIDVLSQIRGSRTKNLMAKQTLGVSVRPICVVTVMEISGKHLRHPWLDLNRPTPLLPPVLHLRLGDLNRGHLISVRCSFSCPAFVNATYRSSSSTARLCRAPAGS